MKGKVLIPDFKNSSGKVKELSKFSKSSDKNNKKIEEGVEKHLSIFKSEYKKIKKYIESKDEEFRNDEVAVGGLKSLLVMTSNLISIAEDQYYKFPNERAAYALVALVSQFREILNDLRNLQDLEGQIQYINSEILEPGIKNAAQNIIEETFKLKAKVNETVESRKGRKILNKALDNMLKSHGSFLSELNSKMADRVNNYLAG